MCLCTFRRSHPPPDLPNASAADWAEAAGLALDWYGFAITGERIDTAEFRQTVQAALKAHADGPRVLILRDFHAENLIWLPGGPDWRARGPSGLPARPAWPARL